MSTTTKMTTNLTLVSSGSMVSMGLRQTYPGYGAFVDSYPAPEALKPT
jgi:hypothetical protein